MSKTILPYPNFKETASVLSDSHLERQRYEVLHLIEILQEVEVTQLPDTFTDETPEVTLEFVNTWSGYEMQLCEFGITLSEEWSVRHKKVDPFFEIFTEHLDWATGENANMNMPPHFGNVDYHDEIKAALVKNDPDWYASYFTVGA